MTEQRPPQPKPASPTADPSLVGLVARGVMDAELAALVWVLVEARLPLVVAAPPDRVGAGGQLLAGIIGSIHPDEPVEQLAGPLTAAGASNLVRGRRAGGVVEAGSLEEVRRRLGGGPMPLSEDQLTFLGCVLVIGEASDARRGKLRVTAAHYVRPLARDAHGHAQRLDPAVLAAWDPRLERYEHFAWGVLPEIAARLGRRAGDLDADLHHRRDDLGGLAKAGVTELGEVRRLIAGYQVRWGDGHDGKGHATDNHATDNHATDNHATDNHATDNHATDNHATDNHASEGQVGDDHAAPHAEGPGHRPH